jgi:hypothetical protein
MPKSLGQPKQYHSEEKSSSTVPDRVNKVGTRSTGSKQQRERERERESLAAAAKFFKKRD